ncbi:MAG TPA: DUF5074 domain-containing protein [Bryobacteraceae bacterium]|nr:DUF5074 domain-containing protein [Bryobacteraceae bacterium]
MCFGCRRHHAAFAFLLVLTTVCSGSERPRRSAADKPRTSPPRAGVRTPGIQIPFTSLQAEAQIPLNGPVAGLALGKEVFAAVEANSALAKLDLKTNKFDELKLEGLKPCAPPVSAFDGIWIADCSSGKLLKLDAKVPKTAGSIDVMALPGAGTVTAGPDSVWLLSDSRTILSRVDPEKYAVVAETRLPPQCSSVAYGEGALWVTCPSENQVLRINTLTNVVEQRIKVEGAPSVVTTGSGSVWVLTKEEGKVVRIDPKTHKPVATTELKAPAKQATMAFGEGALWVSLPDFPLSRIDPGTDAVVQQFGGEGSGLVMAGNGSVWLVASGSNVVRRYDPKRIRATFAE